MMKALIWCAPYKVNVERVPEPKILNKRDAIVHLRFADAGHSFMPWSPTKLSDRTGKLVDAVRLAGFGGLFDLGGKPVANRAALREAWPRAVTFLREHLS